MPHEFLEDVAMADIAFRAWGESLEDTFVSAADAVMNAMVDEIKSIETREQRTIAIQHDELDMLLFNFLQELIYYKDTEQLLLRVPDVRIGHGGDHYHLEADAAGETIDPARHPMRVDVKAVTLHRFALTKRDEGWEAFVILDI
jgi:SHS2 domain-containing protein